MSAQPDNNQPGMKPVRSELWLRVVSALVLIAIALPLIWLGGAPFWAMCLVLSALLGYEWLRIIGQGNMSGHRQVGWVLLGVAYCCIPLLLLPPIRATVVPSGLILLLLLFFTVWASDVFAYFAGRHFGGPKLMPKVSPKKTWSGALGGLSGSILMGLIFGLSFTELSPVWSALGAGVMSVFSQAGDLFESWVKRRFDVKDSSNLIPGHGGFLDRVDGLIVAAVPMAIYVLLTAT